MKGDIVPENEEKEASLLAAGATHTHRREGNDYPKTSMNFLQIYR